MSTAQTVTNKSVSVYLFLKYNNEYKENGGVAIRLYQKLLAHYQKQYREGSCWNNQKVVW